MNEPRNVHDPMIPSYETDWENIDIFVFSNGQKYSPPRKYHLQCEDLLWWETTLTGLARSQYGAMHSSIALYTLEGHPVNGPMELSNGGAYVAVVPPDSFIDSGYEQYIMRASRSWEKRQTKRNSEEQLLSKLVPVLDDEVPQRLKPEDLVKIQTPTQNIVIKTVNADEAPNILTGPVTKLSESRDQKPTIEKKRPIEKRRYSGETRSSILRRLHHPPVTPPAGRKPIAKKRESITKPPLSNTQGRVEEAPQPTYTGNKNYVPNSDVPKSPINSIADSVADPYELLHMKNKNAVPISSFSQEPQPQIETNLNKAQKIQSNKEDAPESTYTDNKYSVPKSSGTRPPIHSITGLVADSYELLHNMKNKNAVPRPSFRSDIQSDPNKVQKLQSNKNVISPIVNARSAPDYPNERRTAVTRVIKEFHRTDSEIILSSEPLEDSGRQYDQNKEQEPESRRVSISVTLPKSLNKNELQTLVEENNEDPNRYDINTSNQRRGVNDSLSNRYEPKERQDSRYISIVTQSEQDPDKQGHYITSLKKGDIINLKLNIEVVKRDYDGNQNVNRTCSLSQLDNKKDSHIALAVCKSCDSIDSTDCYLNCNNPKVIIIRCSCDSENYKKYMTFQEKEQNSYVIGVPVVANCEERCDQNFSTLNLEKQESRTNIVNSVKETVMSLSMPEHNSPFRQNVGCAKGTLSEVSAKRKRDLRNEYLVTKFVLSKIKHPSKEYIVAMRNPSQTSSYNSEADEPIDKKIDFIKVVKDARSPRTEQNACTQTDWYRMLLEVRKKSDGYKFHLPSLDVIKKLTD